MYEYVHVFNKYSTKVLCITFLVVVMKSLERNLNFSIIVITLLSVFYWKRSSTMSWYCWPSVFLHEVTSPISEFLIGYLGLKLDSHWLKVSFCKWRHSFIGGLPFLNSIDRKFLCPFRHELLSVNSWYKRSISQEFRSILNCPPIGNNTNIKIVKWNTN